MKYIVRMLAIAMVGLFPLTPVLADSGEGEVAEILIKIMTPDGPRWYKLGADLSKVDVSEGTVLRFVYEGDTIDTIDAVTVDSEGNKVTDENDN
jgi:hypothetical protein